jgi:YfiR/HmsC-like
MPSRFDKQQTTAFCARWTAAILIGWMLLLQPCGAWGGPVTGREYDVKIGFIYNFVKFVTWPKAAFEKDPQSLILCYVADDPSIKTFYKLDGKIVKDRKIKVIACDDDACFEQCHIIFFATQNKENIQKVLDKTKGRSVLTIGEVEGFTQWGGVINFFEELNRLRFKVNLTAARREDLKVSSQILVSAQIVEEGGE